VRHCQTNPFVLGDVHQLFDRDQLLRLERSVMPKTAISQSPNKPKKRPERGEKCCQCRLLAQSDIPTALCDVCFWAKAEIDRFLNLI
jgi:hypothetical protein